MTEKPIPVASVDLHGKRKEQAIASVTAFLESVRKQGPDDGEVWVCIITGSGHHSPQGPVLREAVRALLDKRDMEYSLQQGKGSFLVNACSGYELIKGPAQACDSKLVVKPNMANDMQLSVRRPNNNTHPTSTLARNRSMSPQEHPKPSEVAADDELLARVKLESEQQHRMILKHEHRQLKQALTASKRDLEWQQEQVARDEEERIAATLKESQKEQERIDREETERLREILRQSREEEERIQREEQALLEHALSMSRLQVSGTDEALNEALQKSLHEVNACDEELNHALSLSLKERVPDEDELVKQALRMSIVESECYIEEVD